MSLNNVDAMMTTKDSWRLVINGPATGAQNMAIDEAILSSVSKGQSPPTIRFYQWSLPTVSLGYSQSLAKEIDLQACKQFGVDVVRRLTGGRAVLHNQEFTYSLIAQSNQQEVAGSIQQSYLAISRGLLQGLINLGVEAELAPGNAHEAIHRANQQVNSAACFDASSRYELVVGGKKLVGSAQTRRQGCILQHGSIPLQLDTELLFKVLKYSSEDGRDEAKAFFDSKATDLERILANQPDFDRLCACFQHGMASGIGINMEQQQLLPEELDYGELLVITKYGNMEWNGSK